MQDGFRTPDDIDKHFTAAIKLAPLHCFHCLGESHMQPQCPLLMGEGSNQPKADTPQGRMNEHAHRQNPKAQTSNQGEQNALERRMEQRLMKQMEEKEKRMLDAIGALTAPRQSGGGRNPSHAEAVRTPVAEDIELTMFL